MALFQNLRELLNVKKKPMALPASMGTSSEHCLCMVVSEQEGAEIWVNGEKTNFVTPHLVAIRKNTPVEITVKLLGHADHTAQVSSSHNLTYYYCNLTRIPFKLISGGIPSYENSPASHH